MTRGTLIPETVTLHVPFHIVKRGGRKEMQSPDGAMPSRRTDSTLFKALARAFRWKQMLESGEFATIKELAEREGVTPSFLTRILRLTLLAPKIVMAVLDGTRFADLTLRPQCSTFPASGRRRFPNSMDAKHWNPDIRCTRRRAARHACFSLIATVLAPENNGGS